MSGIEFFTKRYAELGWQFKEPHPKQAIRINSSNTKGKNIKDRIESAGIRLEKIPFLETGYWVRNSRVSVGATAEYLLGLYSVQESAAQIPATLFTDIHDKTVFDACAAPGGKTVQIADLMNNTGAIIASDINRRRLEPLVNHLERCGVTNTIVYQLDARQAERLKMKFDRILIDAPCSGNFAADLNWFERRTIEDVERNAKLQREILKQTTSLLNKNGEIVYSTCSLEPEENELNIEWAIRNLNLQVEDINSFGDEGLTQVFGNRLSRSIKKCRRIWPEETQGFFISKLRGGG
jgi:NOL1/NOP2/sun family putative RNA methylase